jgi:hypothetical protein
LRAVSTFSREVFGLGPPLGRHPDVGDHGTEAEPVALLIRAEQLFVASDLTSLI